MARSTPSLRFFLRGDKPMLPIRQNQMTVYAMQ